jgi:hypothetical protein
MTREEILKLEAGQEMDDLVAEKIMGWHKGTYIFPSGKTIGEDNKDWLDAEGRYMHRVKIEDGFYEDDEDFNLIYWHPSESIMWALEVIEKMEEKVLNFSLESVVPNSDPPVYAAEFGGSKFHKWEFTIPLAICRAALLASMED